MSDDTRQARIEAAMTTPIDPGDKDTLYGIAMMKPYWRDAIAAVAYAVCPVGYRVVADDDLRRLYGLGIAFKGLLNTLGEEDGEHYPLNDEDLALLDRLRALIGDE